MIMIDPVNLTKVARKPSFLASPLGLAIVLPLIILFTGGGAVWVGHAVMSRGVMAQAEDGFTRQAELFKEQVLRILGNASPVLDGARAWMRTDPDMQDDRTAARMLYSLAAGRPGLAQVYVIGTGTVYHGVRHDADGMWRHVRIDQVPGGQARRRTSLIRPDATLTPESDERIDYDPRQRPFYRLAVSSGVRSWTEPYRFFSSKLPGVTCAEALTGPDGQVRSVLAVDFDLGSLSGQFAQGNGFVADSMLFTTDRLILAAPPAWTSNLATERLIRADDLTDPAARGFFAAMPPLPRAGDQAPSFSFAAAAVASSGKVVPLVIPDGPTWYLGRIVALERVLGLVDHARNVAAAASAGFILLGIAAALSFARHFANSRADAVAQRNRAKAAEAQVEDIGAYRLVKLLGKGGMGEVWLAEHRFLARPAAIKRITAAALSGGDAAAAAEVRSRFSQEARITAALRSRNTIELYDYGVHADGSFFYVMELLDGMDLRALVEKRGPIPLGRVVHLLVQACGSLAEAHRHGLVHRDIKAENLYICRRADEVDVLKVLDFGIVAVQHKPSEKGLTQAGMVQGTPETMSPEQALGESLDGRSDLYSLGCVAWWLITGRAPFDGDDPYTILSSHINSPVPSLSAATTRAIPPALEEIVAACLAKERDQRPADASSLADALRAVRLPAEEGWSPAQAAKWWSEHMPNQPTGLFGAQAGATRAIVTRAG